MVGIVDVDWRGDQNAGNGQDRTGRGALSSRFSFVGVVQKCLVGRWGGSGNNFDVQRQWYFHVSICL